MYETDAARFSVDDNVFLVLNAGREYAFSIASATMVEYTEHLFPRRMVSRRVRSEQPQLCRPSGYSFCEHAPR